jgi:hypothetical protein
MLVYSHACCIALIFEKVLVGLIVTCSTSFLAHVLSRPIAKVRLVFMITLQYNRWGLSFALILGFTV